MSPLFALLLAAAGLDVPRTLKGIEHHYNRAATLRVSFTETYVQRGRRQTEKGELFLRKPGRMRWQYTQPAGKLFISDGKFFYYYNPEARRAERMNMKEADDMRAPLGFLLGRLEFDRDFREFRAREEGPNIFITALPKSDKLPYSEVSFLVTPEFVIQRLVVKGQDQSVLEFTFENEKVNPALNDKLFRFEPPPGVEYIDSSRE